jgi:hypothetical protein
MAEAASFDAPLEVAEIEPPQLPSSENPFDLINKNLREVSDIVEQLKPDATQDELADAIFHGGVGRNDLA